MANELRERLPYTDAHVRDEGALVFAGDLPTISEIGLGFENSVANQIAHHALGVIPLPVSYAWPEKLLLDRTLTQAAELSKLVAFHGDMILGHEMHLSETLEAMAREDQSFIFFGESRHQKGDWFIAKQRAPAVILGHRFSPQDMIPLDFHAACHNWVHLACERGIRFCYANFFRTLHATEPLEGLHYLQHLKQALIDAGFEICKHPNAPTPAPAPKTDDIALTGLTPAGLAASVATQMLDLPNAGATPLALAAAGGAVEHIRSMAGFVSPKQRSTRLD